MTVVFHYDMKKLNITYDKPENLIPYANNHKIHSDEQILRLAASIQEYGFDQPIVVDKHNVIIKGHGRREAAIKLKLKTVPVIINDELDEYQVKAARIADNKTSSNEYNMDALKFDLGTLNMQNYNMALTGVPELELSGLMKDIDQSVYDGELNGEFNGDSKKEEKNPALSDRKEFLLVITCTGEQQQAELFERFNEEGLSCKII